MQAYAFTPNQIADMTPEQQIVAYEKSEGSETDRGLIRCSNKLEALRVMNEIKNGKSKRSS